MDALMHSIAAAGAGFLIAVLWFDLMHDTLVRGQSRAGDLDRAVVLGVGRYYRRVTTDASPMNRLVALFMLAALTAIVVQVASTSSGEVLPWVSLVAILPPLVTVRVRTFPAAVELGRLHDDDSPQALSRCSSLARTVYRDHLLFLPLIVVVLATQLVAASI